MFDTWIEHEQNKIQIVSFMWIFASHCNLLEFEVKTMKQTRYITQAVYNGTKQDYAISGGSVDKIMLKVRKKRELRNATVFIFFLRKTGKMVDARFN